MSSQEPRVPIRPAPPPPSQAKQDATVSNNKRGPMNISKLLPNIMKKPSGGSTARPTSVFRKKAPPPRPPPPKFQPKKQVIDLLCGSPPSSPSPTLRSQESGFEEDPELLRGWSENVTSHSSFSVDWTNSEPATPLANWPIEATPKPSQWKSEPATPQWPVTFAPQWPSTTKTSTTTSTAASPWPGPATMPTIIRPISSRRPVPRQEVTEEEDEEEEEDIDHSPPMPNFPPPAPPPDIAEDVSDIPDTPCGHKEPKEEENAVALYDYTPTVPDDLLLKEGDVIQVLSRVDENWLFGRLRDQTGQFPACFVQIL